MSNKTLGRGLDSLIPQKKISKKVVPKSSPAAIGSEDKIFQLPIGKIQPNPEQPRQDMAKDDLTGLANSIKEHGIIQPLIVTPIDDGYQLIAGERRLRAAKMIGLRTVPAIVRQVERHHQLELALIENIQRKDLNPIEQAVAFRRLIDEFNLTQAELGRRLGISRPKITNILRLLNLPEDIQEAVVKEKIHYTAARILAGMSPEQQRRVFEQLKSGKLAPSGLDVESRKVSVKRFIRRAGKDPETLAREEQLQQVLGTKVVIKKSGETGQIIIDFYSEEDLFNLFQRLMGYK